MKCPNCDSPYGLTAITVEPWLEGLECSGCGGLWIPGAAYRTWWLNRPATRPEDGPPAAAPLATEDGPSMAHPLPAEEGPRLRRCPECEHILARYRVGHGLAFGIDRCRHCHGVWFDRQEWQALRSRDLQEALPHLLTDEWQLELRAAERLARAEERLRVELGADDLARIREVKRWLDAHPQRTLLLRVLGVDPERGPRSQPA